ncbi:restriction endonuclease subunit S [Streptomyces sp. NPDC051105]|uniref:restriction endonuclease subunit S n=1 Tax=Streptomyces sp. NPDC051105 TaxID=3154843 RepID=UPI003440B0F8
MSAESGDVRWAPVGEVGEVRMGKQLSPTSKSAAGQMPYLRVANVFEGRIDYGDVKTMGFSDVEKRIYELRPGDILLNEGQESLFNVGRSAIYEGGAGGFCFQNTLIRFRPSEHVLPEYAQEVFVWWRRLGRFASVAEKTSISHLGGNRFAAMSFPLIPMGQQRRIVDILGAIQENIKAEEEFLAKQDRLWGGVLNQELERHEKQYGSTPLRDVSRGGGSYGSNSPASPHRIGMPRYVRITDIDEKGFLSPADSGAASISESAAARYLLGEGDLLIARTGYTTGKSYLYRPSDGPCAFAGYLVRFRIDPNQMLPDYAFLWTSGNRFREWVSRNVREVGQRNISAREFDDHEVAHPPLSVQRKLVEAAEAAREARSLRMMEINRLRTLRSALADALLKDSVGSQAIS